jgi:hypothetical protein
MIQLLIGLIFIGLSALAQSSQLDDEYYATKLDLLTARLDHSVTQFLPNVQFGASVVFTHSPDTNSLGQEFGSTYLSSSITNEQKEIIQSVNSNWQQVNGGDRIYLSRHFRVDFNDRQMNITLQSHSALIEYGGLKIKLQPRLSSIVWSKGF